jgi:hypothetical protein
MRNMTVLDDTVKGTTLGAADGPPRFIDSLDCEVATFSSPRLDLITPRPGGGDNLKTFKRLDYHVPFVFRGEFRPEQWPENFYKQHSQVRITSDGFVLCSGFSARANGLCSNKAVNRTLFCRNHGGALHPADKKLSGQTLAPMPADRIENLDRTQKFMQGFLTVEELDDDEITNSFVRTNDGRPVKSIAMGRKFEQIIAKELHARINRYLLSKTPRAMEVLFQIVDSDMVEPADRLKAIAMLADRTLGKPADVTINYQAEEKPYESIVSRVVGGSREEYRKSVASSRGEDQRSGVHSDSGRIVDAQIVDEKEPDIEEFDSGEDDDLVVRNDDVQVGKFGATGEGISNGWDANEDGNRIPAASISDDDASRGKQYDKSFLEESERKRKEQEEARDRIKKARSKRFAQRATGSITSTGNPGYLLEYKVITKGPWIGKYKMRMHHPSKITPSLLARVQANNSIDLLDAHAAPPAVDWGSKPIENS